VLSVVTFISIRSTSAGSTDQVIAAAFSTIVGIVLFTDPSWRDISERGHVFAIILALAVFSTWLILLKFFPMIKSALGYDNNE
jgi:hypothetical protein